MNNIAQTFDRKISSGPKSPTCDRILEPESDSSPAQTVCGSWRSRLFSKVRDYRDAIKNIITFDKSPSAKGTNVRSNLSSSCVDVSTSLKQRSNDKGMSMRYSTLNREDEEAFQKLTGAGMNVDDSMSRSLPNNSTASSSLKSFLFLEKQINEEFFRNSATTSLKKKISADPFISYNQSSAEFLWSDEAEDIFPEDASNSLERSNSSDLDIENPRTNSTFCESSASKKRSSTPSKAFGLQDSGIENNFSI